MLGRRFLYQFVIVSLVVLVTACGGGGGSFTTNPPPPSGTPSIALTPFVSGLSTPVDFQTPDDGSGRIFIVQQSGTIRIVSGGSLLPTPFLDISSRINFDGAEQGLLGLAFHPSYSQNKRFYLNYDRLSGGQIQTVIAEYQLTADPNAADPASERILLTVNQPFRITRRADGLRAGWFSVYRIRRWRQRRRPDGQWTEPRNLAGQNSQDRRGPSVYLRSAIRDSSRQSFSLGPATGARSGLMAFAIPGAFPLTGRYPPLRGGRWTG